MSAPSFPRGRGQSDVDRGSSGRSGRVAALAVAALALAALTAGCASRGRPAQWVIPKCHSAAEQFVFASKQEELYRSPFRKGPRGEPRARVEAAYEMVLDNFPREEHWTSRARLRLAMIEQQEGGLRKSLKEFERLIEEYPADEEIQVNAIYSKALIYDSMKEFDKAQECYSDVLSRFGKRNESPYREIVAQSKIRYQRVRKK